MEEKYKALLKQHKLRVTDNRVAMLSLFDECETALSAHDVEGQLPDLAL